MNDLAYSDQIPQQRVLMSKALGAAFLSHQVEQLENKVNKIEINKRGGHATDSLSHDHSLRHDQEDRSPKPSASSPHRMTRGRGAARLPSDRTQHYQSRKSSGGSEHHFETIVIDSSVLIHALDQVYKWCKPHRSETLIVPLEGKNSSKQTL